jgi:hypothetical protein
MKSAVLHTAENPNQAVRWQQEPKQPWDLSTPTINYAVFLYSNEKIAKDLAGCKYIFRRRLY